MINVSVPSLYVGRLQPLHDGHYDALRQCFDHEKNLIIGVGSSQESHTQRNPLSFEERKMLIEAALNPTPEYAGRYTILPIPDIGDNPRWPGHVESILPKFGSVYTASPLTKDLFEKYSSHPVHVLTTNINVCATEVRHRIAHDLDWASLVPDPVAELLIKWNIPERIKRMSRHV